MLFSRRNFLKGAVGASFTASDDVSFASQNIQTGQSLRSIPFLRGTNYSGQESGGSVHAFPFKKSIDYLAMKGVSILRFPFSMERMLPQPGADLNAAYANRCSSAINYILSKGMYVILDPHNGGRFLLNAAIDPYNVRGGSVVVIGESSKFSIEHFADFHTKLTQRFRHPRIIHGLMNEPHQQDDALLYQTHQAAINALREAKYSGLILVNGNNWNTLAWGVASQNRTYMPALVDPLENWAIDAHHYLDPWSSGTSDVVAPDYMDALIAFTEFARSAGMKAFLGEIGASRDQISLEAAVSALGYVEGNKDVFLGWTWWTAVQYQPDYRYQLLPNELTSSDASGPYTDTHQMKVLETIFRAASAKPNLIFQPTLIGEPIEGSILGGLPSVATGYPVPSRSIIWRRDSEDILGANHTTYVLNALDVGQQISRVEIWRNSVGQLETSTLKTDHVKPRRAE